MIHIVDAGQFWQELAAGAAAIALVVGYIALLWRLVDRLTSCDDAEELWTKGNWAYFLQRIALAGAQGLAMVSSVAPSSGHPWQDLGWLALEGLWVLVLLLAVRWLVDLVVLRDVDNLQALLAGNLAVGAVEAGFYLGVGAILGGTLSGDAPSAGVGFASTAVFTVLGLGTLVGVYFLHELLTPYDVREAIRRGSFAAGLEVGGALLAISIVVTMAVSGDFTGWGPDLLTFLLAVVVAIVALYGFRWLIDRVVLTSRTTRSIQAGEEAVASATLAGLFVIAALPVAAVVGAFVTSVVTVG
jgi:uncharacterized membrane protein YjfL (UPF0719 family)